MPYVKISTNVKSASVDVNTVLSAVCCTLSDKLNRPAQNAMVELNLDCSMLFGGSADPCAFVNFRSIGKIDADSNPQTVAELTATVTETLGVPKGRVFVNLNDIAGENWGARAALVIRALL